MDIVTLWLIMDLIFDVQVVNVWEFSSRSRDKRVLTLKQPLYGHTEPVICLAASSSYNIIVSGSRDRTCILWDLSRLVFVRQLRGHAAPVAAVCINELTVSRFFHTGFFICVLFMQECFTNLFFFSREILLPVLELTFMCGA